MTAAGETAYNTTSLHEGLVQAACAQADEQAVAAYRLDAAISTLSEYLPQDNTARLPTPVEFRLDELATQRANLLARSAELQRDSLGQLQDLSSSLSDEAYFGSAALLTSLNPYLLAHAHQFSAQIVQLVSKLNLGQPFMAWGQRNGGERGIYGGQIVAVRRSQDPNPKSGDPNIGLEVQFQPQNTPENQGPITVRHTVQQLIDSRDPNNQLRPNWYVGCGSILGLARPLFEPHQIRVKEEIVTVPARTETLARYVIAAWAADIDLFSTAAFSITDQDKVVERLSELCHTPKQEWQLCLAIDALKALGEFTPELRRTIFAASSR